MTFSGLAMSASAVKTRVRHFHDADIRFNGAERIVLRRDARLGQRIEQSVDLPTLGRPTMPHFMLIPWVLYSVLPLVWLGGLGVQLHHGFFHLMRADHERPYDSQRLSRHADFVDDRFLVRAPAHAARSQPPQAASAPNLAANSRG